MTSVAIVIPFRDRGIDPLRQVNLDAVIEWWVQSPWSREGDRSRVCMQDDGRSGDEQFNRSAAYNRAVAVLDADVFVFTEADMLIPYGQIEAAISIAASRPGLVVPFTEYRYMHEDDSPAVRDGADPERFTPERVMRNGRSIGAVNVVSRETLRLVGGYTERTEGNWYDDDIMHHAFDQCAGSTRWVSGPAYHLYHLPGWKGDHLTDEDRAATARNKALWEQVQSLTDPAQIRALLHGGGA